MTALDGISGAAAGLAVTGSGGERASPAGPQSQRPTDLGSTLRWTVSIRRETNRQLKLADLPAGSNSAKGGGAPFVAYCLGADVRAKQRRGTIERAAAAHRRASNRGQDAYPTALILCQRLGVALEDLARVVLALESLGTEDPFEVVRMASYDALDEGYARLSDEPEGLRRAFRLPAPEDTGDVEPDLREAILAASDALSRRWLGHWERCAAGWQLLRRLAKALRHGGPLLPRELVLGPPGAGALGAELNDAFDRWVLLVGTEVDHEARGLNTTYAIADVSDKTLARAHQAGLEGVALARELANGHVFRLRSESRWALPGDVMKLVEPRHRRILRSHARG